MFVLKNCITFRIDENYDIAYPEINVDKCINCGRCRDICPALNPLERSEPYLAYAAWSSDVSERHTSASGGIATEIYKYAIAHNWAIVGATFYKNFKVGLNWQMILQLLKSLRIQSMYLVLQIIFLMI